MNPYPTSSISHGTGAPCDHPGCFAHVTHPCEGCGRLGGRELTPELVANIAIGALLDILSNDPAAAVDIAWYALRRIGAEPG